LKKLNVVCSITLFISLLFFACEGGGRELPDQNQSEKRDRDSIKAESSDLKNSVDELSRIRDSIDFEIKKHEAKFKLMSHLSRSSLDHIVLSMDTSDNFIQTFSEVFGFLIKPGREHENGIYNRFIEFNNESEIEFISVTEPSDELAYSYSDKIRAGGGLEFVAIRSDSVDLLSRLFTILLPENCQITTNELTTNFTFTNSEFLKNILFFKYNLMGEYKNSLTTHPNGAIGIKSVWLNYSDIKWIQKMEEMGFIHSGRSNSNYLNTSIEIFTLNNFELFLVNKYDSNEMLGISIELHDINQFELEDISDLKITELEDEFNKSIFISLNNNKNQFIELFERKK